MKWFRAFLCLAGAACGAMCVDMSSANAQNAEEQEAITGVIAGAGTTDTAGLFSPAGTNLTGYTVQVYFHYLTGHFHAATKPFGNHKMIANADLPGASTIAIVINGVRRIAVPQSFGGVDTSSRTNQLLLQSDFYSGSGTEIAVDFTDAPDFTNLTGNSPRPNDDKDYLGFELGNQSQETLTFEVTQ